MPNETGNSKKKIINGLVQAEIPLTEAERYYVNREAEENCKGKRIIEIPDDNWYTLDQRTKK